MGLRNSACRHMVAIFALMVCASVSHTSTLPVDSSTIPFRRVNDHIYVSANINGRELTLLLDSGSTVSSLDQSIIDRIISEDKIDCSPSMGMEIKFIFGDVTLHDHQVFNSRSTGDNCMKYDKVACDGILGFYTMSQMITTINFKESWLRVTPKAVEYRTDPRSPLYVTSTTVRYKADSSCVGLTLLSERLEHYEPCILLSKDSGKTFRFLVDIGAGGMLLRPSVAKAWGIIDGGPGEAAKWNSADTTLYKIKELNLDQARFRKIEVEVVAEDDPLPGGNDGFIGITLLEQYETVTFDVPNHKFYLCP